MNKITPIILSGGSGTRLWPLSRQSEPKQFLELFNDKSLFLQTIERVRNSKIFNPAIIICNYDHRFLITEELKKIDYQPYKIILEPCKRNTAPAIAIAAFATIEYLSQSNIENDQDTMLVMPCDHLIKKQDKLLEIISEISNINIKETIITLGIKPNNAETGYGYINHNHQNSPIIDNIIKNINYDIFAVNKFIEKPNLILAKQLLEQGNNLWNSGIFIIKATNYINQLKIHQKDILKFSQDSYRFSHIDLGFTRLNDDHFAKNPDLSIDYAILEKSSDLAVIPIDIEWSDVGSWDAISKLKERDQNNNNLIGNVVAIETNNCFIYSKEKLCTSYGINNLIIINLKDALLIIDKNHAQQVKKIFEFLQEKNYQEINVGPCQLRPWGSFEILDIGDNFKLKKIIVKPHSSLSLQMHNHRCEHWVVVKGSAVVFRDDEKFILESNQSTYIKAGCKHRLVNDNDYNLEIIEVQTGSYIGEDDIIRFDDIYGRK